MSARLCLRSICIAIGPRKLVTGLDLEVAPGEVVTLMGPSGSGKSTLLDYVGGHLGRAFSASGPVLVGEADVTALAPERRRIGVLFQDDLLFPHLSVWQNVGFGLARSDASRRARRERVAFELARVGLAGLEDQDPATLSGGQRARVALLRTLLSAPRALLLDEPFGKLDAALRSEFRRIVFDQAAERGLPVLLVTHDRDDAAAAAGPVVILDDGVGLRS